MCKTRFSSKINHLSAEVDVFCEWIDECHLVNNEEKKRTTDDEEAQENEEAYDQIPGY